MNSDIRIKTTFFDNRKTKRLMLKLGPEGVLSLLQLWVYAAQNHPTGELSGFDSVDIELSGNWSGNEGDFVKTITELGFIEEVNGAYKIHDWLDHQPFASGAENRSDKARFSKLKQVNKAIYNRLYKQGIRAISKEEYSDLTRRKNTTFSEPLANASEGLANVPAPTPTPTPTPTPSPNARDGAIPQTQEEFPNYSTPLSPEFTILQKQLFDAIWEAYPRQTNFTEAKWEFAKMNLNQDQVFNKVIPSIEAHKEKLWDDVKFIPALYRFLRERRFEESLEANGNLGGKRSPPVSPREKRIADIDAMSKLIRQTEERENGTKIEHSAKSISQIGESLS